MTVRQPGLNRYSALFMFICSGIVLYAQNSLPTQGKTESTPPNPGTAPEQILVFQIRPAFSLTSAMVHALQAGTSEGNGGLSGLSAQKSASAPASDSSKEVPWGERLVRNVPFGTPLDVRIVGQNVVTLIQIVPIAMDANSVDLMVQGQVWVKRSDDSLSFKTTIQTLSLPFGARLYYYPLGFDAKAGAPIAVEIRVEQQGKQD